MVGETTIGHDSRVEQVLGEYGLQADGLVDDLVESDTDRLLLALLLEQRDQDLIDALDDAQASESGDPDTEARYYSAEYNVDNSERPEWAHVDFGLVASSVDLRISANPIEIRFQSPGNDDSTIEYATDESPVVGIPAETSQMWVRTAKSATGDATVDIQAWR